VGLIKKNGFKISIIITLINIPGVNTKKYMFIEYSNDFGLADSNITAIPIPRIIDSPIPMKKGKKNKIIISSSLTKDGIINAMDCIAIPIKIVNLLPMKSAKIPAGKAKIKAPKKADAMKVPKLAIKPELSKMRTPA
jgi:hypothetical protein